MGKNSNIKSLTLETTKSLINILKKNGESVLFSNETTLFYQGHVPIVAYLILSGTVDLIKNKKVIESVQANSLLGPNHLLSSLTSPYEAVARKGCEILFCDKSLLLSVDEEHLKT